MMFRRDLLVAEKDHEVFEQCLIEYVLGCRIERRSEVDT